jgi:hypothetical protein
MRVELNGKIWDKEAIQDLIDKSAEATARALLIVYDNQTASERAQGQTIEHNGVGFSSRDAEFLTNVAQKYKQYGRWASERQLKAVRRCVRRYHKQVLEHMLATKPEAKKVIGRVRQNQDTQLIERPKQQTTQYGAWS